MSIYDFYSGWFGRKSLECEKFDFTKKIPKRFGGKHLRIKFAKDGFYVQQNQIEPTAIYQQLIHNDGDNYFIARNVGDKNIDLFDMNDGNHYSLYDLPKNNFAVTKDLGIYLIKDGNIVPEALAQSAVIRGRQTFELSSKAIAYILAENDDGSLCLIDENGTVVIPTISKSKDTYVAQAVYSFPNSKICLIVSDKDKNVAMTENGVVFEAAPDEDIIVKTYCNSYAFSAYNSKTDMSRIQCFNEYDLQTHEFLLKGKLSSCEVTGKGEFYLRMTDRLAQPITIAICNGGKQVKIVERGQKQHTSRPIYVPIQQQPVNDEKEISYNEEDMFAGVMPNTPEITNTMFEMGIFDK